MSLCDEPSNWDAICSSNQALVDALEDHALHDTIEELESQIYAYGVIERTTGADHMDDKMCTMQAIHLIRHRLSCLVAGHANAIMVQTRAAPLNPIPSLKEVMAAEAAAAEAPSARRNLKACSTGAKKAREKEAAAVKKRERGENSPSCSQHVRS